MPMEDFFQVGIITSTHGLRGEVKVYPTTDDVRRFKRLKEVILVPAKEGQVPKSVNAQERKGGNEAGKDVLSATAASTVLKIESVKFFKQFVILKFQGLDRIEDVEKYCRYSLMVTRENAVRLGRDEYFVADLIGLTVKNEDGAKIGILSDVMETGANDVYVIRLDDGRELLLPAIRQCVLKVDIEAGYMKIHILDGLLDSDLQA